MTHYEYIGTSDEDNDMSEQLLKDDGTILILEPETPGKIVAHFDYEDWERIEALFPETEYPGFVCDLSEMIENYVEFYREDLEIDAGVRQLFIQWAEHLESAAEALRRAADEGGKKND